MKSTLETDKILSSTSPEELNQYLTGDYMNQYSSLKEYLLNYMGKHGLQQSDVVRKSLLSRGYANQIINGIKENPSREKLIPICIAMHMTYEETNRALKIAKAGTLYSKDKRDAIIISCINNNEFDVMKINELLADCGFEPLG